MKKLSILIFTILLFSFCNNNKFDVDISKINVNIDFKRLDKDLIQNYPDTPDVYGLMKNYGKFLDLYSYKILQIGGTNQKNYAKLLNDFNQYCFDYELPQRINKNFNNLENLKSALQLSLRYYKYYFPNFKIPQFYTYISNFSQSVVVDDSILGIGLDKYLGSDCDLYGRLGFDTYKKRRMKPEMIAIDCIRAIIISEYPYESTKDNLLGQMIYEGKVQYCLDACFPNEADSLKFSYTKSQMLWAEKNESNMWSYIVDNQHLFSSDAMTIRSLIAEAPFTSMFSNNSAPRAAVFLGWKIVHKYMEGNSMVSVQELMENTDYQSILNKAQYKP